MSHLNMAKRAALAVRNLITRTERPTRPAALAAVSPGVTATRVMAGALALGLALMTPLAFGAAAYGSDGEIECEKIEFTGNQPTTWTSDGDYVSVTVKAGQETVTWNDVKAGQVLGPIIRDGNDEPIEFSNLTKCTATVTTTTVPEEVTTTTVPEEVTTTTVPEEVTTTTVPEEVTTTTAEPNAVPSATVPVTSDPVTVRAVVSPRTSPKPSSESLPFTGSQHLQLLAMIGVVTLASGLGIVQLVARRR